MGVDAAGYGIVESFRVPAECSSVPAFDFNIGYTSRETLFQDVIPVAPHSGYAVFKVPVEVSPTFNDTVRLQIDGPYGVDVLVYPDVLDSKLLVTHDGTHLINWFLISIPK